MCNLKLSVDTVKQRETKLCVFSQCFSNFNTHMHDLGILIKCCSDSVGLGWYCSEQGHGKILGDEN